MIKHLFKYYSVLKQSSQTLDIFFLYKNNLLKISFLFRIKRYTCCKHRLCDFILIIAGVFMTSKIVLDLKGVISPLSLLKCKSCLKSMEEGDILEVMLADIDVVRDLTMIVKRSQDEVVYKNKMADCICLGIKRGSRIENN